MRKEIPPTSGLCRPYIPIATRSVTNPKVIVIDEINEKAIDVRSVEKGTAKGGSNGVELERGGSYLLDTPGSFRAYTVYMHVGQNWNDTTVFIHSVIHSFLYYI